MKADVVGINEPYRACPRCGMTCDCAMPLTPCDRPYPDCTVCKGTGKHDGDPCAVCVWKRWAEDARAAGALKTPEELEAERVEGRDIKPENVTRALNILSGAVDGYDYSDDKDYQGHAELLRNAAEAAYQALLGTRVETPETSK